VSGALTTGLRPSSSQEALLRVIAAPPDDLEQRWSELQPLDLDRIEHGSMPLLLLVYERLRLAALDGPLMPRLKGAYRNVWYRNQLQLGRLPAAIAWAGDGAILFGDVSIATRYYADPGLRLITRLELMSRSGRIVPDPDAVVHDGAPPHLSAPARRRALYESFAARAESRRIGSETVATLDPGDELLFACADGVAARPAQPLQWLLDVWQILRLGGMTDPGRVAADARDLGIALQLRDTVGYLSALDRGLDAGPLLSALAGISTRRRDRLAYRLGGPLGGPTSSARSILGSYLRLTRLEPTIKVVAGLPAHLAARWGVRPRAVAFVAASKGMSRATARRRRAPS
jgi:hypothetical protein